MRMAELTRRTVLKTAALAKEAPVALRKSAQAHARAESERNPNTHGAGKAKTPGTSADPRLLFLVPAS